MQPIGCRLKTTCLSVKHLGEEVVAQWEEDLNWELANCCLPCEIYPPSGAKKKMTLKRPTQDSNLQPELSVRSWALTVCESWMVPLAPRKRAPIAPAGQLFLLLAS